MLATTGDLVKGLVTNAPGIGLIGGIYHRDPDAIGNGFLGTLGAGSLAVSRGSGLRIADEASIVSKGVDKSWKDLIDGTAQATGTPGHAFRSYREAIAMAKSGEYELVRLNRSYRTTSDYAIDSLRRPDVIGVRLDGRIDAVEVPSRTDYLGNGIEHLFERNYEAMQELPPNMRGNVRIAPIR